MNRIRSVFLLKKTCISGGHAGETAQPTHHSLDVSCSCLRRRYAPSRAFAIKGHPALGPNLLLSIDGHDVVRRVLASAKLTFLPRSSTTSRTTDSEYLFGAECFLHRVCPLVTTDMGRLCRKAMTSALSI